MHHIPPTRDRQPVKPRCKIGTGEDNVGFEMESQGGAGDRAFQARRAFLVAEQPVSQTKRKRVHRAGGRHAHIPVAETSGVILYGRHGAALDYFEGTATIRKTIQEARNNAAPREAIAHRHLAQVIEIRLDSGQARFRPARSADFARAPLSGVAVHDDLGEQRIVKNMP